MITKRIYAQGKQQQETRSYGVLLSTQIFLIN